MCTKDNVAIIITSIDNQLLIKSSFGRLHGKLESTRVLCSSLCSCRRLVVRSTIK